MTEPNVALGIGVMVLATYLTRFMGVFGMRFVPITPAVKRFLEGMASTVLIAVVVPYAYEGDWAMRVGVVVAVLVMARSRKTVLAMLLGCVATALIRLSAS